MTMIAFMYPNRLNDSQKARQSGNVFAVPGFSNSLEKRSRRVGTRTPTLQRLLGPLPRFPASTSLAVSLAWLGLIAGCAVGPDYKRPEATTIPPAYMGATNVVAAGH